MTDTSSELAGETTARSELRAQLEAERQRQVDERMLIREYVERMFAYNDGYIARACSPCADGVNAWLGRQYIPGMYWSAHSYPRLMQGTPEQMRDARRYAESRLTGLDPDALAGLTDRQLRAQLASVTQQGANWRTQFISSLRTANDQWTNIPDSLVVELINRLNGVIEEAQPQAAPFPVPEADAPPVPPQPQPQTVTADVMVALSLRLSGPLAQMSDTELQEHVISQVRTGLRNRASQVRGAAVDGNILANARIIRR
jgi:hypothetical protein